MHRRVSKYLSLLQVNHPAGQALDLAQVVAAENQGHAGGSELGHQRLDLALGGRVQAGGGLIKQQDLRLQSPGACQRQPLLLPTRERFGRPLSQLGQPHLLKSCQRLHAGCAPAGAGHPQAQGHIVLRRGTQHVRALKQHGLRGGMRAQTEPAGGRQQAMNQAQQSALATAVRADQRHPLAARNVQRASGECRKRAEVHAGLTQRNQDVRLLLRAGSAVRRVHPAGPKPAERSAG